MTEQDIPQRIAMPSTFASTATKTTIADVSGNTLNYKDGFPSSYDVPLSQGGRYITREDINAVLNLPTNDLFYYKCGGVNVYDKAFSQKIGGYPKGAILKYISGNNIYDVISLIDNNTYDFTETPTYINNIYWTFLNKPEFSQRVPPSRDYLFTLSGEVYGGISYANNALTLRTAETLCVEQFPSNKVILCSGKVDVEPLGGDEAFVIEISNPEVINSSSAPSGLILSLWENTSSSFTYSNMGRRQVLWLSAESQIRLHAAMTDSLILLTDSTKFYAFKLLPLPLPSKADGVNRYTKNVKYTYTFDIFSMDLTT